MNPTEIRAIPLSISDAAIATSTGMPIAQIAKLRLPMRKADQVRCAKEEKAKARQVIGGYEDKESARTARGSEALLNRINAVYSGNMRLRKEDDHG